MTGPGGPFPQPGPAGQGSAARPGGLRQLLRSRRNKAIASIAAVIVLLAVAGVLLASKLSGGPTDPGCKIYASSALTAYNKLITDLNGQASQAKLNTDMSAAVAGLTSAADKAQSASAKSAISGLLSELQRVRTDVGKGAVPAATVNALNAAATAADNAC